MGAPWRLVDLILALGSVLVGSQQSRVSLFHGGVSSSWVCQVHGVGRWDHSVVLSMSRQIVKVDREELILDAYSTSMAVGISMAVGRSFVFKRFCFMSCGLAMTAGNPVFARDGRQPGKEQTDCIGFGNVTSHT
jgi:hypothetical protein